MKMLTLTLLLNILASAAILQANATLSDVTPCSQEFLITEKSSKKKKLSSNDLKEEIGQKTKQMFDGATHFSHQLGQVQCTLSTVQLESAKKSKPEAAKTMLLSSAQINQSLGMLGQELASLQKTCSAVIEKLIDNQKPFKKASKTQLEQTLGQLTVVHQQLGTSAVLVKGAQASFKTAEHINQLAKILGEEESKIKTLRAALNQDHCLKQL